MIQNDVQKHIKNARDILVGKIPDPKSQVDQITLALMYKFMDDMDKDAEELGGQPKFFTGEYAKYAWHKLMDVKVGSQERLNLYDEALKKLPFNKNLPALFREIFKDAFLPYRDPNTLSLFLKEINHFSYDNSERLGDAFEHLLSVMASQGDAGQFRTPRHIIDFIVDVVDPDKNDTILDPACGTAGFLISAYNHILNKNKKTKPGDKLNPDDKEKLIKNFAGYDISPDMVRLSLVNMYLHGFKQPNIFEYDTLANDSKWGDFYNVLLANPPFMTPRGGIKPHSRFEIKANRSEVLFVDYIMEHLTPKGKAGVIVPEGIIFQSSNAYKDLRKMLVDNNYLYAVVSLPAGVFNPYSGVKTSILFMDKDLAKRAKQILFIKIENDGLNLGAQRRPIDKNDLPQALQIIKDYKKALADDKKYKVKEADSELAHLIDKKTIAESGDYNLTGDRYKETIDYSNQKWPMVKLEGVIKYEQPTKYIVKSTKYSNNYKTPVLTPGKTFVLGYTNETKGVFNKNLPVVIFDDFTTAMKFVDFPFKVKSSAMKILRAKQNKADIKFLFYVMQNIKFNSSRHKRYWISQYSKIKIPLPPLKIQKQIVKELDNYQKIIDGAKQVVKNWKPSIKINPKWESIKLGDMSNRVTKGTTPTTNGFHYKNQGINFIKVESIDHNGNFIKKKLAFISRKCHRTLKRSQLRTNDILFSIAGALGRVALVTKNLLPANTNQALAIVSATEVVNPEFLEQVLRSNLIQSQIGQLKVGVAQKNLSLTQVSNFEIPTPPLKIQKQIVARIKEEQKLVNQNKKLIKIFEQKIKDKIDQVWGK